MTDPKTTVAIPEAHQVDGGSGVSEIKRFSEAVVREVGKLHRMTAPMPIIKPMAVDKATGLTVIQRPARMFVGPRVDETIRRILRIEVSHEFYHNILSERSWGMERKISTTTFMGVAVYICGCEQDLPECGWRVVNPFDNQVNP